MVIPEDTEVCAKMTSDDVLHNFWIPKLAGKRYLVPGQETEQRLYADDPGEYWGTLRRVLRAQPRPDAGPGDRHDPRRFRCLGGQPAPPRRDTVARLRGRAGNGGVSWGEPVSGCHIIDGVNDPDPATLTVPAPDLTHFADRHVFAGATLPAGLNPTRADWEAGLKLWLADPPTWKPGSFMSDLGLTADEIDALVAYLSTLE